MFTGDFNPAATLAATSCPRCAHVGLLQVSHEEYASTPKHDLHEPKDIIDPSLYVRCPVCRVVAEWPDCENP
jgi:phage FluMu protein Com